MNQNDQQKTSESVAVSELNLTEKQRKQLAELTKLAVSMDHRYIEPWAPLPPTLGR